MEITDVQVILPKTTLDEKFNYDDWQAYLRWKSDDLFALIRKQHWMENPPQEWINDYGKETAILAIKAGIEEFLKTCGPSTEAIVELSRFVYKYSDPYQCTAFKRGLITKEEVSTYMTMEIGQCVEYVFTQKIDGFDDDQVKS